MRESSWKVEILNQKVLEELETLPIDMKAKFDHIIYLVEEFGLHQVHAPYIKHLQEKLWEMRVTGRDGIARAIYVTQTERRIVILHVFRKKTQKTPKRALKIAQTRLKELL